MFSGEGILVLLNAARIKMCNAFEHQAQRCREGHLERSSESFFEVIPSRATIWAAAFECRSRIRMPLCTAQPFPWPAASARFGEQLRSYDGPETETGQPRRRDAKIAQGSI